MFVYLYINKICPYIPINIILPCITHYLPLLSIKMSCSQLRLKLVRQMAKIGVGCHIEYVYYPICTVCLNNFDWGKALKHWTALFPCQGNLSYRSFYGISQWMLYRIFDTGHIFITKFYSSVLTNRTFGIIYQYCIALAV